MKTQRRKPLIPSGAMWRGFLQKQIGTHTLLLNLPWIPIATIKHAYQSQKFLCLLARICKSPASPANYNYEFYSCTCIFSYICTATTRIQGTIIWYMISLLISLPFFLPTYHHFLHSSNRNLKMPARPWHSLTLKPFDNDQLYLEWNLHSLPEL